MARESLHPRTRLVKVELSSRVIGRSSQSGPLQGVVTLGTIGQMALLVKAPAPELKLIHALLDFWAGVGLIVVGLAHQRYDLQLTAYDGRDWRANFFPAGIGHSMLTSTGWESTPWRAVQRAAWTALTGHHRT